jgi:hypothetical protein
MLKYEKKSEKYIFLFLDVLIRKILYFSAEIKFLSMISNELVSSPAENIHLVSQSF